MISPRPPLLIVKRAAALRVAVMASFPAAKIDSTMRCHAPYRNTVFLAWLFTIPSPVLHSAEMYNPPELAMLCIIIRLQTSSAEGGHYGLRA